MSSVIEQKLDQWVRNRLLQHIFFWLLSFLVLINIFKVSAYFQFIDGVYTLIFLVCIALPVYINLMVLIPAFLARRAFVLYGFVLSLVILAGIGFYFLMFNILIDHILPGYFFIAYYSFFDILLFLIVFLFITSLLKLARAWFKVNRIENEKNRISLNALKAQVNPHFLFNTLSSIYATGRKKSDNTPEVILKLSEVLRYMIYETDVEKVSLEKEIGIIRNIIDIHRIRLGDTIDLNLTINGNPSGVTIAPLILVPFVENSFKHGKPNTDSVFYIKLVLTIESDVLRFTVINSKNEAHVSLVPKNNRGLGLNNCRNRLNLLYPGKHKLAIKNEAMEYRVDVTLNV